MLNDYIVRAGEVLTHLRSRPNHRRNCEIPMTDIKIIYTGPIVKRADAISQGLKKYFTGKPCKHGHLDQRRVGGGNCIECVKIHHAVNHDKVVARKRDWSNKNPDYFKIRYENNKDDIKEYQKEYIKKNREKLTARSRVRYLRDRDKIKIRAKKYREENRDQISASKRTYKARKRNAEGHHTAEDVLALLDIQKNKCAEPTCRVDLSKGYHVDHIMPLILGGSNWPNNLQCLCPTCNMRKNAKHPIDWANQNGRLI